MKLYNSKIGLEVSLCENQILNIVLESPECFSDFVYNLDKQVDGGEGDFVLAEAEKELALGKTALFVANPLVVDCNEKRIISQLYRELSDYVQKECFEEFSEVNREILNFVDSVIEVSEYSLITDIDFVLPNLLKYCNVQVSSEYEDFSEKLVDYLRAIKKICKIEIVFVLNIKQYFSIEQLQEIYKFCFYNKIILVNIENVASPSIEGDKYVIIDKDLCILEI